MGKRSEFKRRKNDFYETPEKAVLPLLPHLEPNITFNEPCAGAGKLIDILQSHGHNCIEAWDIDPQTDMVENKDARTAQTMFDKDLDYFITNPPWTREILHPIIENLSKQKPTWLLFDADWMHNKHAQKYLPICRKIVSVGRVKWIENSSSIGKDNAAWYLFFDVRLHNNTIFINNR